MPHRDGRDLNNREGAKNANEECLIRFSWRSLRLRGSAFQIDPG